MNLKQLNSVVTKYLLYLTVFGSIIAMIWLYSNMSGLERELAIESFDNHEQKIQRELINYFHPIGKQLEYQCKVINTNYDSIFDPRLVQNFYFLLNESEQISSLMQADSLGNEIMLLELNDNYYLRKTKELSDSTISEYFQLTIDQENNFIWEKSIDKSKSIYHNKNRPWFKGAIKNLGKDSLFWTDPYIFFTTKDLGITVSKGFQKTKGEVWILAFDIKLNDISKYTRGIKIEENGKVFILSKDTLLLGLPFEKNMHPDSLSNFFLKKIQYLTTPLYQNSIEKWRDTDTNRASFSFNNEDWLYQFNTFYIGNKRLYIAQLARLNDFKNALTHSRRALIISIILLSLFMINMIRAYKRKRKTNIQLKQQKNEIEHFSKQVELQRDLIQEAHLETLNSISYAKRIQMAFLPNSKVFNQLFPNSFLWFSPKDIVSGDFYWFGEKNNRKWLVAADCTGHGVPGALLSVMGTVFLNDLIINKGIDKPNKVLDNLKNLIINTLKENNNGIQPHDGMDIAILCFNSEMNKVDFAGAKNPLYLIRDNELTIYKADRMAVGFEDEEINRSFTNHSINIRNGDALYIFSDGIADQFGGPLGKKFMYKRLKETLLAIHHKEAAKQKKELISTFNNWKNQEEQIDDIVLIGVIV